MERTEYRIGGPKDGTPRCPTLEEYNALSPESQGYASYMRADWPGAEIPKVNPHPEGSAEAAAWDRGEQRAIIDEIDTVE